MTNPVRQILDLLSSAEKRRLLKLMPVMALSSLVELLIISSAAAFFSMLGKPTDLPAEGAMGQLQRTLGWDTPSTLVGMGLLLLLVVIMGNVYSALAHRFVFNLTWTMVTEVSRRLLSRYLRRPYEFFLQRNAADLTHRLIVEVQVVVSKAIVSGSLIGVRSVSAVALVGFLLYQEPTLTLLIIGVVSVIYGSVLWILRRMLKRLGRQAVKSDKKRHRIAMDSMAGVKVLKISGLEDFTTDRFAIPSAEYASSMALANTIAKSTKYALEGTAIVALVMVVVVFLVTGRDTAAVLPVLATFAIAMFRLLPTFQLLFNTVAVLQTQLYALEKIHDDYVGFVPEPIPGTIEPLPFRDTVALHHVSYSYPNTKHRVLDNLSFELDRGSWTAIVGTTGAGKTTLVDIIMGLLHPTEGAVVVDGVQLDAEEVRKRWQRCVGYVPQAIFFSDDTIAANIAFGVEQPDVERVREVARIAQLADFVESLPDGYNTMVGDRGTRLSGGQRQRLGIARALYAQPGVLVLDEATSALDNQTEAQVVAELREQFGDTTVVMIAHRLSTTRHCDRILVLDGGDIVAVGSYDELLRTSPLFNTMVQATDDPRPIPLTGSRGA